MRGRKSRWGLGILGISEFTRPVLSSLPGRRDIQLGHRSYVFSAPKRTRLVVRLRRLQLKAEPLCKFCLVRGIVTVANTVDHVEPHRSDWTAFVTGKLQ